MKPKLSEEDKKALEVDPVSGMKQLVEEYNDMLAGNTGNQLQHNTNGGECFCGPQVIRMVGGGKVVVHNEEQ